MILPPQFVPISDNDDSQGRPLFSRPWYLALDELRKEAGSQVVDVTIFGAVGDGKTDNLAAFRAAAAWAAEADNRALFFPSGHYKYSGGMWFTRPVTLYGTRAAILDYTGAGYALKLGRDGLTEVPATNRDDGSYVVLGLTFTGGSLTEHGIFINNFVTNVEIVGTRFDAFGPTASNKWAVWWGGGNWRASMRDIDWWNESTKHTNFVSGVDDPNTQLRISRVRATQGSHGGKGIRLLGWHNSVSDGQTDFFDQPLIIGAAAGYATVDNWYMETRSNYGAIGYEWAQGLRVRNCYANLHSNEGATGSFLYPTGGGALILDSDVSDNRIKNLDSTAYLVKQNTTSGQPGNTAWGNEVDDTRPFPSARTHTHHASIEPWYGTDGDTLWPNLAWTNQVNTFSQDQYYDGESWVRGNQHVQAIAFFLNFMALYSGKAFTGYSDAGTTQTFKLDAAAGTADFNGGYKVNGTTVIDSSGAIVAATAITQHVVTGSRAIGSTYQNTTGKPMTVTVSASGTGASTVITGITAYSDTGASPSTKVAAQVFSITGASYTGELSVTFQVPNGSYYKIVGNNSPTLTAWIETY